jgi:hypothetical protein
MIVISNQVLRYFPQFTFIYMQAGVFHDFFNIVIKSGLARQIDIEFGS